jgi:hypothetical protein
MKVLLSALALMVAVAASANILPPVQTVFIIVLENHNWSDIEGSASAPYFNGTLLPMGSHCEQYYNPPSQHPSEPNYLWLEAGTNFGILDNNPPAINHQNTGAHLTTQLWTADISWKAYQEDIDGNTVPLVDTNAYVARHDPFMFFDDITGTNNPLYPYGLAHIRPYTELAGDLTNNTVARYNFITPNLCDDGHDTCAPEEDSVHQIDDWLASQLPMIFNSPAYTNNGAIFITWDEGLNDDGPIGLILLSPLARGGGYSNSQHYTHSSLLRTVQEIFNVSPLLGDAANAADLSDLFAQFSVQPLGRSTNGAFRMNITTVQPYTTNILEASTNLLAWTAISTNWSSSNSVLVQDTGATNYNRRFYRARQVP